MALTLRNVRCVTAAGHPLDVPPPSPDEVLRSLLRLLGETGLCAWATTAPDGRPHVNIGHFAHSGDLEMYLLSDPASQHGRNVAVEHSMAAAVFPSPQSWGTPGRGAQLFGTCAEVAGGHAEQAERLYGERFPPYAGWKATVAPGDPAAAYRFYRFVVERLKILDETEFGDGLIVEADVVRPAPPG